MSSDLAARYRSDVYTVPVTDRHGIKTHSLVAAATIVRPTRNLRLSKYDWQTECWNFYRSLGAFRYGMLWFMQAMSRVRLTAAVIEPGGDEPTPITEGPAADLMRSFFGGPVGQSQYMKSMTAQLNIPGEGFVVAQPDPEDEDGNLRWSVHSVAEMRIGSGKTIINGRPKTVDLWQVQVDEGAWETLPYEALVFRQWRPDEERSWQPDSPARGVLKNMRTIELLERRIVAMTVSRLASNGILLYPQEVTFPPKPGYENEYDPFTAEWLDIASKTIENPGSAQAAIPMPVKVPQEYIDKFVHMDFANKFDEKFMDMLAHEYDQLATGLNMPKEIIKGMGQVNHWSAWQLDEQGIKVHIAPEAELIVQGLTKAYLHPSLKSLGQPTITSEGELVVWYDTSELVVQPNHSDAADQAYDRQAISARAFRREKGFDEGDAPDNEELRKQLLLQLAKDPTSAPTAIEELTGKPLGGETPGAGATGPGGGSVPSTPPPAPAPGPPPVPSVQNPQPSPGAPTGG